jgi:hypothetical protein
MNNHAHTVQIQIVYTYTKNNIETCPPANVRRELQERAKKHSYSVKIGSERVFCEEINE